MSDVFDSKKRSDIMSKVRSNNNKSTELALIKFFKENHITGWKRNYPVKGHPDFVFLDKKIAVFVDGCFWHGHDCRNTRPSDNAEYWRKNVNAILSTIKKLQQCLKIAGGQLFVFGNVN